MSESDDEIELTGGGRTTVHRHGQVVLRDTGPWTPAVRTLLRHLERVGFDAAPRLVGSGLDRAGRETFSPPPERLRALLALLDPVVAHG